MATTGVEADAVLVQSAARPKATQLWAYELCDVPASACASTLLGAALKSSVGVPLKEGS